MFDVIIPLADDCHKGQVSKFQRQFCTHLYVAGTPAEGSGVIAYADLSPGQDPVLANQIRRLLYDVSQRHSVGVLKGYGWLRCDFTWVHPQTEQQTNRTSKTMQIWALHTLLAVHYHTTDDIVQELNTCTQ